MRTEQLSHWRVTTSLGCWLGLSVLSLPAMAQVVVTDSGQPSYSYAIKVPPGAGGFAPQISLVYDGTSMGVLGKGWRIDGIPSISRCQPTRSVDGAPGVIKFESNDKLCLNGERLIQTNANGEPLPFPQAEDAGPGREYRTERDKLVRVRSYDQIVPWDGDGYTPYDGPSYFKVWTRDGRIQTIKASLNPYVVGATVSKPNGGKALVAWPFVVEADRAGNVIKYTSSGWGQFMAPSRIGYNGGPESVYTNPPQNNTSVVFNYEPVDSSLVETAYYRGSQNTLGQRLASIDIMAAAPSAISRKIVLSYSGNLLQSIKECVGVSFNQCLPPTSFGYTTSSAYGAGAWLGPSQDSARRLLGDFNGDGRTDMVIYASGGGDDPTVQLAGRYAPNPTISGAAELIKDAYSPIVADFDGDGLDDIFVSGVGNCVSNYGWGFSECAIIFRSLGNGQFAQQVVRLNDTSNIKLSRQKGAITAGHMSQVKVENHKNFVLGDFNLDGRLDIVRVSASGDYSPGGQNSAPGIYCSYGAECQVQLMLGNGDGTFTATAGNTPTIPYIGVSNEVIARDRNGDGIPDLTFGSKSESATDTRYSSESGTRTTEISFARGYFAGRAAGGFEVDSISTDPYTGVVTVGVLQPECDGREFLGDFNGDGLVDAACFREGVLRIHTWTGVRYVTQEVQQLYGQTVAGVGDFDGDGKADFLTGWLSAFRIGPSGQMISLGGLPGGNFPNGISGYRIGTFGGRGGSEFLVDSAADVFLRNSYIYAREQPAPYAALSSVTESGGAVTTLTYESLAGTVRHASDRGTAYASMYPQQEPTTRSPEVAGPSKTASFRVVDTVPPSFVVTKITTDTGVGTAKTTTELAYRGFKSDLLGRGALGFREIRRQTDAPDGTSKLTTVQQRLQTYPYTGAVSVNENYLGALSPIGEPQTGAKLSRTENTYCDLKAAAGAEAAAKVSAPCPVTSKVLRPYVRKTVQSAWDLNGTALPVTTTTNTYTGGYPTLIEVKTVGSSPAGTQTFVNSTVNEYFADSIGGDNWLLGLVKKSTVTKTVPNSLGAITTSAGTAPKATATAGP
jgi:hypothetical protein